MVNNKSAQLDAMFRAIADPTRRAMLRDLAGQPRTVSELAGPFEISLAAASKHIKSLERAGLIQRTVQGRTHFCRLNAQPMHAGLEWMRYYEQFWSERLDQLEALLHAEDQVAASPRKPRSKRSDSRSPT